MIGCGHVEQGQWHFAQWTCDRLTEPCEERIIDTWLGHMAVVSGSAALPALVIHWEPAEPINYELEYDSVKKRHPDKNWPELRWFDFLNKVIKPEPVVVRSAMAFGLKAVARQCVSTTASRPSGLTAPPMAFAPWSAPGRVMWWRAVLASASSTFR